MELNKNQSVSASMMDTEGYLSVVGVFQVIQDAVTELMGMHGIDGATSKKKYNAFWVYIRSRVKITKRLWWNSSYTVTAFFSRITAATITIDVCVTDEAGETAYYARTELCPLDIDSGRIRRVSTVGVNKEAIPNREAENIEFCKFEAENLPIIASVKVRSQSIDFSHHTNNTEYVRMIMNTYSVKEIEALRINEMEMIYVGQSYENDTLNIRKAILDNKHLVVIEKDGNPVIKCEILL